MNGDELIQTPYGKKRWSYLKRCMDSHDELVAVCKQLASLSPLSDCNEFRDAKAVAKEVIAKAEGGGT